MKTALSKGKAAWGAGVTTVRAMMLAKGFVLGERYFKTECYEL